MKTFPIILLGVGCIFTGCSRSAITTYRCVPMVESNQAGTGFRLRAPRAGCTIDENSYQRAVRQWLDRRATDSTPINNFFLGRAIDYPWISQYLARAASRSTEWDLKTGTSHNLHPHALVKSLLMEEAFRQRLDAPFVDTPYTVGDIDIEKLLVGDASTALDEPENGFGKVPFDALLSVELTER